MLTLGSWFVLGHWLGVGYCPITDWHWRIKDTFGEGRPPGSYIQLVLEKASRRRLNGALIDQTVLVGTLLIGAVSLILFLVAHWPAA